MEAESEREAPERSNWRSSLARVRPSSRELREPDERMLQMMRVPGGQVGQFVTGILAKSLDLNREPAAASVCDDVNAASAGRGIDRGFDFPAAALEVSDHRVLNVASQNHSVIARVSPAVGGKRCGRCWSRAPAPSPPRRLASVSCAPDRHLPRPTTRRAALPHAGAAAPALAGGAPGPAPGPELRGTLIALRALARRVQALTVEERELKREIEALVARLAPALLDERASAQPRPNKCSSPGRTAAVPL